MTDCSHDEWQPEMIVDRFQDHEGVAVVRLRMKCTSCGECLRFAGLETGVSMYEPTTDPEATEVFLPAMFDGRGRMPDGLPNVRVVSAVGRVN